MKKLLHIIYRDKFTATYINFMKTIMNSYTHIFITTGDKHTLLLSDYNDVYIIDSYRNITNDFFRNLFQDCDQIIVSGIFGIQKYLVKLPIEILEKVSLQFWGGDFYGYRDLSFGFSKSIWRKIVSRYYLRKVISKCDSLLFLIPDDYYEYLKIINIPKKHFICPVPLEPNEVEDYAMLRDKTISRRILVGNSATKENEHKEAFEIIKLIKDNVEVMCPLSYGDSNYGNEIIEYGKNLFGEKFIPLTKWYEKCQYIDILATCEIGVFNNNRQQALWNIYVMLAMGKKVFIRSNTPMWDWFKELGVHIYDIDSLKMEPSQSIFKMDEIDRVNNMGIIKKVKQNDFEKWSMFFKSNV